MIGHKKTAVIADIHGNSWALESVLESIYKKNIPEIINLGDIFYGPLTPAETFNIISQYRMINIAGNADRFLMEVSIDKIENPSVPINNSIQVQF